jgi:enterobactin synthetase component D
VADDAAAAAAISTLIPQGIRIGHAAVGPAHPLLADEAAHVAQAVPRRQATFAAGRTAARHALALDGPLLPDADRVPVWPPGWCGSITHTDRIALALASQAHRAVAIDAELDGRVAPDLYTHLFTPTEIAGPLDPTLAFSAKECLFKLLFPTHRHWFGFDAAVITHGAQTFRATTQRDIAAVAAGTSFDGVWTRAAGHVVTAMWLPV